MAESTLLERLAAKHWEAWTGGGAITEKASERQARWWLNAIRRDPECPQWVRRWISDRLGERLANPDSAEGE